MTSKSGLSLGCAPSHNSQSTFNTHWNNSCRANCRYLTFAQAQMAQRCASRLLPGVQDPQNQVIYSKHCRSAAGC
jgi:hypothetical protein